MVLLTWLFVAAASIAHLKGPPWNCEHCKYSASQKGTLITHMRTHTGEKPYACDQCSYRSSESSTLTRHKRTHTGEKPYACDQCSFRSSQSSSLTTHKCAHHNSTPRAVSTSTREKAVQIPTGKLIMYWCKKTVGLCVLVARLRLS